MELCECWECEGQDGSCFSDCGVCEGCLELRGEREEVEFEINCAQGRL
jgi:hypothetical protein